MSSPTPRVFKLFLAAMLSSFAATSFGAVVTTGVNVHSYAGTNVTTSAYSTIVASTPYYVSKIQICDTSTKVVKFAIGAASSERDAFTVQVSGCVVLPYIIPAGSRLSAKAVDATASAGYNTIAFIP